MEIESQRVPEVPSPKATAICTAISERCEIQFLYQGQPILLEPHILFNDIAGEAIVEGIVRRYGFVRFRLSDIRDHPVLKRGAKFTPDLSFNPVDPSYCEVFCSL